MTQLRNKLNCKVNFTKEGSDIIELSYKGISIEKMPTSNMFYVQSLMNSISKTLGRKINNAKYAHSEEFYNMLSLYDSAIEKHGNVYIKRGNLPNTIKIGRMHDVKTRYSIPERKTIIKSVGVHYDSNVESRLLNAFKRNGYELVSGTNETFRCKNMSAAIRLFNDTIKKSDIVSDNDINKSKLFKFIQYSKSKYGMWGNIDVCRILINKYIEKESDKANYNEFIQLLANRVASNSIMFIEKNKEKNIDCLYWMYYNYIVIQNNSDLYVNGSRLWNTICKADDISKTKVGSIMHFLKSDRIKGLEEEFGRTYGNIPMYKVIENKAAPDFSGVYIHYILLHFVVEYLDARYALMVSKLMYYRFRNAPNAVVEETDAMIGGYTCEWYDRFHECIHTISDLRKVLYLDENDIEFNYLKEHELM